MHSLIPSIAIFIASLLVAGCRSQEKEPRNEKGTSPAIQLVDAIGNTVTLEKPAQRIISLAPNITEMAFALGAGNRVIGRTTFANYPPEVLRIEIVGDYKSPNFERILALKPDLVLMTIAGNEERHYKKLRNLGLNVFAMGATGVESAINALGTLGILLGTPDTAKILTKRLRFTIDSVSTLAASSPAISTFVVIDKAPLITVSSGFIAEQIELAGGANVAAGAVTAYPTFNREELVRLDPDVIIVPAESQRDIEELLALYPEWQELKAVRTGNIRTIPYELIARPGPRIAESIATLYRLLHTHK